MDKTNFRVSLHRKLHEMHETVEEDGALKLVHLHFYFFFALAMSLPGASPVISHQMHRISFMCFFRSLAVMSFGCGITNAPCVDANHHHYYNVLRIKALIPC